MLQQEELIPLMEKLSEDMKFIGDRLTYFDGFVRGHGMELYEASLLFDTWIEGMKQYAIR